jgi:hypothetical protein
MAMATVDSRQRLSDQQWQQLFVRFDSSVQTVQAFCEREGLSVSNFYRRRALAVAPCGSVASRAANRGSQQLPRSPIGGGFIDLGCLSSEAPTPPAPKISTSTLSVRIDLGGGLILQIERT